MKRQNYFLLSLAALAGIGMFSCKSEAPKTIDGIVMDASMNNMMVIANNGDTLSFWTTDLDPAKFPGVLIDDSVQVTYQKEDYEGVSVLRPTALTITKHSPYFYIQGSWVMPNPIDTAQVQGFALNQDGTAQSINMATLLFESWNLESGDSLILQSKSIGNKVETEGFDTLKINKLNADSLILSKNGYIIWNLARQK